MTIKIPIVLIVTLCIALSGYSQGRCYKQLDFAIASYHQGNYYAAVKVFNLDCLKDGFNERYHFKGYKLLIECYRLMDEDKDADMLYQEFVNRLLKDGYREEDIPAIYSKIQLN